MSDFTSPSEPVSAVVLAAGKGTRMRSSKPKALHPIAGLPMVGHVLAAIAPLSPEIRVVVVGPGMDDLTAAVAPVETVEQTDRLGTGDAVKCSRPVVSGLMAGTVLVLFGDTPFIKTDTIRRMVDKREAGAAVVALGFRPDDPTGYGRLVLDTEGGLQAIVEDRDADEATRRINLCNSGVMAIEAARLFPLIDRIDNNNAKGEYYLTDIVKHARAEGLSCAVIEAPEGELLGVDSLSDLAGAEARWQRARRAQAMDEGAALTDPTTVWFSHDTQVGRDVLIGQNVVFGLGVTIESGAEIRPFCHLEGVRVGPGATIGPFARLRPGTEIGEGARVGNFVEVKNAVLGSGAKANHLAYVGDASVGMGANIGAGVITCNYDGYLKHRTEIGEGAFVGSNSALVAPVSIGDGAIVGAGSTITRSVDADDLGVARGDQKNLKGLAKRVRAKKMAEKERRKPR